MKTTQSIIIVSPSDLLIVSDMQEGFRSAEAESLIPMLERLCGVFTGHIVFTEFYNRRGSRFERQLNWRRFQNATDISLLLELQHLSGKAIRHSGYTLINKPMKKLISSLANPKVFLTGIYTDVCITKTAMDLFDHDVETYVIADACHSLHGQAIHETALISLGHILGKDHIINSDQLNCT
ncbi:MAG TPA: isochorismatase family protein [Bacteroidales bacterium]|nr:isochorismatase family protein [Bacteroidales bacterium]